VFSHLLRAGAEELPEEVNLLYRWGNGKKTVFKVQTLNFKSYEY